MSQRDEAPGGELRKAQLTVGWAGFVVALTGGLANALTGQQAPFWNMWMNVVAGSGAVCFALALLATYRGAMRLAGQVSLGIGLAGAFFLMIGDNLAVAALVGPLLFACLLVLPENMLDLERPRRGWTVVVCALYLAAVITRWEVRGDLGEMTVGGEPVWWAILCPTALFVVIRNYSLRMSRRAQAALEVSERVSDELRSSRDQLDEALREARRASEVKSRFLASVSHELRTPLNSVIGYSELVAEEIEEGDASNALADMGHVLDAANHLLALVDDVLYMTRVDAEGHAITLAPTDLAALVSEAVDAVAPRVAAEVELRWEVTPRDLAVVTDGPKVRHVLRHLLENAARFTTAGHIAVTAGERDGVVSVRVEDTGVGIPAQEHEAIFEGFTQLGDAPDGAREGTGLGLTISRRLARALGGELTLESAPSEGSTFTLTLPEDGAT
jgi:signal transduction histidine kinase